MTKKVIEIWRQQLGRCRNSKGTSHLTQQFFLLGIQPSDENIRGLKMVHHVRWSEMVGLGEVVSPGNSDPNRFIRVLLYFDGHLIMRLTTLEACGMTRPLGLYKYIIQVELTGLTSSRR